MQQNKTLGALTLFSETGGGDLTIISMFDAQIITNYLKTIFL